MNRSSWEDGGVRGEPADFGEATADLGWPEPTSLRGPDQPQHPAAAGVDYLHAVRRAHGEQWIT